MFRKDSLVWAVLYDKITCLMYYCAFAMQYTHHRKSATNLLFLLLYFQWKIKYHIAAVKVCLRCSLNTRQAKVAEYYIVNTVCRWKKNEKPPHRDQRWNSCKINEKYMPMCFTRRGVGLPLYKKGSVLHNYLHMGQAVFGFMRKEKEKSLASAKRKK